MNKVQVIRPDGGLPAEAYNPGNVIRCVASDEETSLGRLFMVTDEHSVVDLGDGTLYSFRCCEGDLFAYVDVAQIEGVS